MQKDSLINLAFELWPINRSLAGEGNRKTIRILEKFIGKKMRVTKVPTGTKVFDWVIPPEWLVNEAYVIDPSGNKILDFKENNLHLVSFSEPVNKVLSLNSLNEHLYSSPSQPKVIPYVTSYYNKTWGFCISHEQRLNLKDGNYEVLIDSKFEHGFLEYGEYFIPGQSKMEILLSTYICHPSMANNELSGPIVLAEFLRNLLLQNPRVLRKFSIRIVFLPETIGSITYIKNNLNHLRNNVVAGYVITCVGDDRNWSFLPSKYGNSLSDRAILRNFANLGINFKTYSWMERGSDERQYCSPGVDLPIASFMRSKYGEYPEYHTSDDKIGSVVTEKGLRESINFMQHLLDDLDKVEIPISIYKCEPQMGKRNLYHLISEKNSWSNSRDIMNVLTFCDGKNELQEISRLTSLPIHKVRQLVEILKENELVELI